MSTSQVFFASRIPVGLKRELSQFCDSHGMKMNFLVSEAIREKLGRLMEDEADVALIRARAKNADLVGQKQMEAYFKKRSSRR